MISSAIDRLTAPGPEPGLTLADDLGAAVRQPVAPSSRPRRGDRWPDHTQPRPESPPDGDLERLLFLRYQRDGDLHARRQLIERYLPLARSLARRYERRDEPSEDLLQVASLGLVKAIDRFDPERGFSFSSFGVPTIVGELKRHFRDNSWALHVPRGTQERVLQLQKAAEQLSGELGRSPTPGQLGERTGLSTEQVLEALDAGTAHDTVSLDAPVAPGRDQTATIADSLGEIDARLDRVEYRDALRHGIRTLSQRERVIIYFRFVEGLTQREIGERMGISQMHVSRLIRHALERLAVVADAEPVFAAALQVDHEETSRVA